MKKIVIAVVLVLALCMSFVGTAFAADVRVCPYTGCSKDHNHTHKGTLYNGHHNGDGHSHSFDLRTCPYGSCTNTNGHSHKGVDYNGHHSNDGHGHSSGGSGNHNGGGHGGGSGGHH